jgi:hypothetical protein
MNGGFETNSDHGADTAGIIGRLGFQNPSRIEKKGKATDISRKADPGLESRATNPLCVP